MLPRTGLAEAARRGRSPSRYLELFRSAREQLLSEGAVPNHVLLDTTWQVSLDQLQQDDAAAVQLLRHVAFLAADPFPVAVLADQEPTILPGPLHEVLADPVRRDRTLGALHRYALVRRDGDSIRMHGWCRPRSAALCHRRSGRPSRAPFCAFCRPRSR